MSSQFINFFNLISRHLYIQENIMQKHLQKCIQLYTRVYKCIHLYTLLYILLYTILLI